MSNVNARNNKWINNIGFADPKVNSNNTALGNQSYGGVTNKDTVWHNNLTFNGTNGQASLHITSGNATPRSTDGNKLGANPRFVRAAATDFDFRLASGSPAIGAGTAAFGLPGRDLAGMTRANGTVDIGAYEFADGAGQPSKPAVEPAPSEPPATQPPANEPPATEPPASQPPATEPPATEPPSQSGSAPGFSFAERTRQFETLFGRNPTFGASTTPPAATAPAPATPPTQTFTGFSSRFSSWRSRF